MATPFETAVTSGATSVVGFLEDALPLIVPALVAFLGIKYVRKIIRGL